MASGYLAEAVFVCERWGALAKAQLIRMTYAGVLALHGRASVLAEKPKKILSNKIFALDLETVVQASQTISNEVTLQAWL